MISFVEGVIESKGPDHVILNVGGIGFLVKTSTRTADDLGAPGTSAVLHTWFMIRDESAVLYGFGTTEEREVFLELVSVSGVGPRVAVAVLGTLRPAEAAGAIVRGDTALLSRIPGVGKKIAARVCVELASRMDRYAELGVSHVHMGDTELVEALTALGYSMREAVDATRTAGADTSIPLEDRLRKALRVLATR